MKRRIGIAFLIVTLIMSNILPVQADEFVQKQTADELTEEKDEINDSEEINPNIEEENLSLKRINILYNSHIQNIGWQGWKVDGGLSGTVNEKKQIEAIQIKLDNYNIAGDIEYRTHIQNIGWQNWKSNGEIAGTTGQKLRVEAIEIKLTGQLADIYDIYYRVHSQNFGWLGWAKNGETAGTEGYGYRAECIEIKLVKKGEETPVQNQESSKKILVSYQTHIQNIGDQEYKFDGATAGTSGKQLRMEGIRMKLPTLTNSSIEYRVHVEGLGWQAWKKNNEFAGTTGQKKRIEAIEIKLKGAAAEQYDVYYRVHCQQFGWLDWAKNGESAGTAGYGYRMEGIEIKLIDKRINGPSKLGEAFKQKLITYQARVQNIGLQDAVSDGQTAGTEGNNLRMEGIKIDIPSLPGKQLSYRSYVQDEGWQDWKSDMQLSGTTGQSKGIEVIQIQLSGSAASEYDIYYRVHVANLGWLGWTKNGEKAGSRFYNFSIEAIQIQMLKKGDNSITIGESYKEKEGIQNGIDVSEYNGDINWSQVKKSQVSFAMLRCVKGSNPNNISVDAKFNQNIKGASDNGISVGVYRYSYADTASEARKEAMAVVNAIQNSGYRIQYPIAYDIEDENVQGDLSKAQLTEIIKIFKGIVENHGYKFMIYANKNWLDNKIDMNSFEDEDVWIARYRDYTPSLGHGYTGAGNVTIWQYSDRGTVPGIQGAVDMNIGYKEY